MSYSVLERSWAGEDQGRDRAREHGLEVRRRNPLWLLVPFVLVGFGISVASFRAGWIIAVRSADRRRRDRHGIPLLILMIQATPEARASVRELAAELDMVASAVVFHFLQHAGVSHSRRRRGQGESARCLRDDAILPEGFVFLTADRSPDSEEAELAGRIVHGAFRERWRFIAWCAWRRPHGR